MRPVTSNETRTPPTGRLLFGVLGGAVAWASHLAVLDMTDELGCVGGFPRATSYASSSSLRITVVIVTAVALLVTLAAWLTALANWRATRGNDGAPRAERASFLAVNGLVANGLFFAIIMLAGVAPLFFLGPCGRT